MKNGRYLFAVIILFLISANVNAQSFGFGCLGLSGFYGGYTQHNYEANGINQFVTSSYNGPLSNPGIEFKQSSGFRIGANIFRAKFESLFVSAKAYYQFLREEHSIKDNVTSIELENNYKLSLNHWGLALDLGVPIFKFVDWKIIEGGVLFYNSELTHQMSAGSSPTVEVKYSPEKVSVGYYVGTGVILHIIPDYISVEGTAAYNFTKADRFTKDNSGTSSLIDNAISKYGFIGTVQLNVGFPF